MKDPLLEATEALRAISESASPIASTRTRVLASLEEAKKRSTRRIVFVIPLAALLIGSVAFAAAHRHMSGSLREWLLGNARPPLRGKRTSTVQRTAPQASSRAEVLQATIDAGTRSDSNSAAAENAMLHQSQESKLGGAVPNVVRAAPQISNARGSGEEESIGEEEYERYRVAHDAHFVRKDPNAALLAWSEYLAHAPAGRLAVEARYNRALCLVKLGRNREAIAALKPFTDGTYGAYRQREAQRLISALYADAGQF